MSPHLLQGAAVFDGNALHPGATLMLQGAHVAGILPSGVAPPAGVRVTTLAGGILGPGLIDLQVNGGDGIMLGDPTPDAITRICAAHARLGSTTVLPTLITDTPHVTARVIAAGIAAARAQVPGFGGLHLEGPHLDRRRAGAHDPSLIRPMDEADLAALCAAAAALPALMVTLAPEAATPGQIAALADAGAIVSLGHSDTDAAGAQAAFAAGARCVTHLFNAMSGMHHRAPGLVGATLARPSVHAGLIADGHHIADDALRVAIAARQGRGLFLVSDAMAVAGTALTQFSHQGRVIHARDGRLTLACGTLAGAAATLPQAVAHLRRLGVPTEPALAMACSAPAEVLGLDDRGHLYAGGRADLVHLAPDGALLQVWQAGAPLVRR